MRGLGLRTSGSQEASFNTTFQTVPWARVIPIAVGPLEGHEISFWDHDQLFNKNETQEDRREKQHHTLYFSYVCAYQVMM